MSAIGIDAKQLRRAFSNFMTGVTVVSSQSASGAPVGFTANSFTSVSLNPPLLLVCPGKHLNSYAVFNSASHFAVNILAENQKEISNRFASSSDDRFSGIDWHRDAFGSPLLGGSCASFSCRVHQRHDAGDHLILVGEVLDFEHHDLHGLGYCASGYFSLRRERDSNARDGSGLESIAGAIVVHNNAVLMQRCANGKLRLPRIVQQSNTGARDSLRRHFAAQELDVRLDVVYSVYDDLQAQQHCMYICGEARNDQTHAAFEYVAVAELPAQQLADPAEASMLNRFADEYKNQSFGLYLGNHESGEVHRPGTLQE